MAGSRTNIRLALEQADQQSDGLGGYRQVWRRLGWVWGEMALASTRLGRAPVDVESVNRWRITLRAAKAGDPRRPEPGQRLRHQARVFLIEGVAEKDADGRWLICSAREEVQR